MRNAERARDLAQAQALLVHRGCLALALSAKRSGLRGAHEPLQASYLSLRWVLWLGVAKELGGSGTTVIVRAHVAGATKRDKIVERVVSGESEWL